MDPISALLAFTLAAFFLTLTPGLDTALVLRTAAVEGGLRAMLAGLGISCGVIAWGFLTAVGLGALLAVSELAFALLRMAGAAYLFWLGFLMVRAALSGAGGGFQPTAALPDRAATSPGRWFLRGLFTNLLNPKVGVFYVSFLPQFLPPGVNPVGFSVLLAAIHGALGIVWFAALVLATRPLARWLARPVVRRSLDGITGAVLIGFGLRLALERRAG
ncbi:LysE family translocator [Segnochrobactraceae bacterium EtOH-i3]